MMAAFTGGTVLVVPRLVQGTFLAHGLSQEPTLDFCLPTEGRSQDISLWG